MELREERVPWIVADVESGLPCVLVMRPGKVVNVLIALLQATLRTAKIGARSCSVIMDYSRLGGVVRGGGYESIKNKPAFVDKVGSDRSDQANIQTGIVDSAGSQ